MMKVSALSFCSLAVAFAIHPFTASAQRTVLNAHVPQIVKEGRATRVGLTNTGEPLQVVISLPLRNQAAMAGVMADLYNPKSPNFHHFLTPEQFDAQFGPTAEDFSALVAWARTSGLTVLAKSVNRHILTVAGTVSVMNRAFHVELTNYHDALGARDFHAPDREPSLDLDVPVLTVSGLDTSNPRVNMLKKGPAATATAVAETVASGVTGQTHAAPVTMLTGSGTGGQYLPSDMRAAYYTGSGGGTLTGTGQSVAVFSYDGYLANDLKLFFSKTGMANTVPVTNVLTGGFDGGCELDSPCDDGEQILDIVQVMGMAPGLSNIYFYEGLSAVTELNQMVSDNSCSVITSSWSGGDFGPGTDPLFQQMALQGQTYLNATGDSGAYNGFTYLPPGLSPYIVEVGGTDMVTTKAGGPWSSEPAWVDSGGGYFDPAITIPTWQQTTGVVTASNTASATMRNSPDMAAEGNYDNVTVINGTFETGYGGTSYATPRVAGYIALANQQSTANGYGRLGFINPLLYELGLRSTASTYYHDITSGSAPATKGPAVSHGAVAGYDLVTGWGSPNYSGLINALTGADFSITVNPTAVTLARGSSVNIDVPIAGTNGFATVPAVSVSGLPSGVTSTVVVNSASDATVTLTADTTVVLATNTVTVTATALTYTRTATLALTTAKRAAQDFTISATNVSVQQLATGSSTITVNIGSGAPAPVDLTYSGVPTGVTATLGTTPTFSTSTLTLSTAINATPGTYTITVTGNTGQTTFMHSTTFTLTITAAPGNLLTNGDFETSSTSISPWTGSTTGASSLEVLCNRSCGFYPHSGLNYAYLDGYGATHTDVMYQTITIPSGINAATLNFWLWISSQETTTTGKNDTLTVAIANTSGTVLSTVATFSNLNKGSAYVLYSYDLTAYAGQTVRLQFTGVENSSKVTGFLLDDISVLTK